MQEYLETSMAIDKITKEQVSEGTSIRFSSKGMMH